jgi:hypothetical protein
MTTFNITDSVFANTSDTQAFNQDSALSDTLTVAAGAYLIATGSSSFSGASAAVFLAATKLWTVNINGGVYAANDIGLVLNTGIAANTISTIKITADGQVGGGNGGIEAGSVAAITNA